MIHLNELLNSLKGIEADNNEELGLDRQDKGRDESCDYKLQENTVLQKIIPTVLIVLNKTDLADPTTHALAINFLRLGDIVSLHNSPPLRRIQIFSGSCMNLQLSAVLLKWIEKNVKM
jgi:hypothetical protein